MRGGTESGSKEKRSSLTPHPRAPISRKTSPTSRCSSASIRATSAFSNAKADGSDLRFVSADDKSPLKYHIEKFDPKEEIALVWVKVPRISGGSNQDSIWMYYGNPSAPDGQDAGGTYDVNQVAVYHLGEKDGNPKDATAYGNHAASFSGKLGLPSVVGNGAQFSGTGELMTITRSASLNFAKGFTFSTWIRLNQPAGKAHFFSWDDGKQSIIIGLDDARVYCSLSSGEGQTLATPKTAALDAETVATRGCDRGSRQANHRVYQRQ